MVNRKKSPARRASTAGCGSGALAHSYFTRQNANRRLCPTSFADVLNDSTRFSSSSSDSGCISQNRNLENINRTIDHCLGGCSSNNNNNNMMNRRRSSSRRMADDCFPSDIDIPGGEYSNYLQKKWIRYSLYFLIVSVAAWCGNKVRYEFSFLHSEVEQLKKTVNGMKDAELDTLYKINKADNFLKELKQGQENFRISIQHMVQQEIEKLNTDKTGRTDFALESAGGSIVQLSQRTENYGQPKSSLLGISLCEGTHGPRYIIQKGTSPGECWALKGSSGGVIVRLLGPVKIDAISMEHISSNISPSGDSTTAPKDFSVWGMKNQSDKGQMLGQFQYDIEGPLVQTFAVPPTAVNTFELVELRIISNHGNPDFTCVYRFRVHGTMEKD